MNEGKSKVKLIYFIMNITYVNEKREFEISFASGRRFGGRCIMWPRSYRRPPENLRCGLRGAGGRSTESTVAANMERGV